MRNLQITFLLVVVISLIGYTVYAKLAEKHNPQYNQDVAYQVYLAKNEISKNLKDPQGIYFAGERVPTDRKHINDKLKWEMKLVTYWKEGATQTVSRAKYWLPIFEQILAANDIPTDFKYLAVVESNLTNVVSPAGATGFWQLMPSAANMAGLEVNAEVDERYHPIKATYAAVKYLKYAHGYLNNWTNVAASYNMGVGGMQYALRARGTNSYYDLFLNAETARYVFKTVAFKQVYENLEAHGLADVQPYAFPTYRKVKVTENISNLATFAKEYDLSLQTLKEHNPWLRANSLTIKNGKTYEIWIPVFSEKEQKAEMDRMAATLVEMTTAKSDTLTSR